MGQERGKLPGSSNSPAKGPDNTKVSTLISTLAASADTGKDGFSLARIDSQIHELKKMIGFKSH